MENPRFKVGDTVWICDGAFCHCVSGTVTKITEYRYHVAVPYYTTDGKLESTDDYHRLAHEVFASMGEAIERTTDQFHDTLQRNTLSWNKEQTERKAVGLKIQPEVENVE